MRSEETAVISVVRDNTDILPWGWMPVWVVISLFWAFETVSVSIVVLSGSSSITSLWEIVVDDSVSSKESLVSVSGSATSVVFNVLMDTIFKAKSGEIVNASRIISSFVNKGGLSNMSSGNVGSKTSSGTGVITVIEWDGVGGRTISDDLFARKRSTSIISGSTAHVLQNNITVQLRVTTAVLGSPLNGKLRAFIKGQRRADTVTSSSIVLGIEKSVGVVSVSVVFVESVIGTSRVLHVAIAIDIAQEDERKKNESFH